MNFLPGWNPGFIAGAPRVISISVFGTATANNTTTITCPANIIAGDLIVLIDNSNGSLSQAAEVIPAGFTLLNSISLNGLSRQVVSWKKAVGTEGGTSVTGMAAGGGSFGRVAKVMYVFRGNTPATVIAAASSAQQGTSGNPTAQTVTSASGVAPLVVCGFYGADAAISPRTFTVGGSAAKDGETNMFSDGTGDSDAWIAYKIYNTAPADVVVDMDDEGGENMLQSCYFTMA